MYRLKQSVWKFALPLVLAGGLYGQTTVNGGRAITGKWDASGAATTKPAKTGTTLPATCAVGEQFFNTSAAPGVNLYACTATNTWTPSAGGVPSVFGRTGAVTAQSGDYIFSQIGGTLGLNQIGQSGASTNQVLTWSGTQWSPAAPGSAPVSSVFGRTGAVTAQNGDYIFSQIGGALATAQLPVAIPLANLPTIPYSQTSGVQAALGYAPENAANKGAANGYAPLNGSSVVPLANLPTIPANTNQLTNGAGFITATGAPVQSVFGRLGAVTAASGDYTTAQVSESGNLYFTNARAQAALSGLYQIPLAFSAPLSNSLGTVSCPAASGTQSGCLANSDWTAFNGKQAALTFSSPLSVSSNTVSLGTVSIANGGTGATTQQAAINALSGTQTSGYYLRSNGTNVSLSGMQAGDVPTLNQNTTGTAAGFTGSLAGDVSGTQSATVVGAIRGVAVAAATPVSGQVLVYNGSSYSPALASARTGAVQLGASGGTAAISSGLATTWIQLPYSGTITGWTLSSLSYCTIAVDTYGSTSAPPSSGSIWSTLPALSSAQTSTASGLNISVTAGEYLILNVQPSPAPTCTSALLYIAITKN
jgi:hypothetical protein